MKHFVINRFNIKIHGRNSHLKREWLEERFVMYKDTVRSLGNQTNKEFKILLLVHPDTPIDFLDKIRALYNEYDLKYHILYVGKGEITINQDDEYEGLNEFLARMRQLSKHKRIITSRIDTDDMYANDYIQRVKESIKNEPYTGIVCVDFKKIIYTNGKQNNIYKYPHTTMFLSICSPIPSIHCFSQMHTRIHKVRNVKIIKRNEIGGKIMVHGKNVSNIMRGKKTEMSLSDIFK